MNAPRIYRTDVVVLRHRKLGEADKILTLFSADQGKFDAIAKGIRKPGSRKAGHLEVLTHARVMLAKGRNLDVITQAEALEAYLPLRDDVESLAAGLYVAELIDRYTAERVESYPLFRLTVETLGRLTPAVPTAPVLRFFEINLLAHAGYQPELRRCVICGAELQPVTNSFGPVAGGVVCPACTPAQSGLRSLSVRALKVLRLMQAGRFTDTVRLRWDHDLGVEVEGHLRAAVQVYLERDLNSLQFLNGIHRGGPVRRPIVVS